MLGQLFLHFFHLSLLFGERNLEEVVMAGCGLLEFALRAFVVEIEGE